MFRFGIVALLISCCIGVSASADDAVPNVFTIKMRAYGKNPAVTGSESRVFVHFVGQKPAVALFVCYEEEEMGRVALAGNDGRGAVVLLPGSTVILKNDNITEIQPDRHPGDLIRVTCEK